MEAEDSRSVDGDNARNFKVPFEFGGSEGGDECTGCTVHYSKESESMCCYCSTVTTNHEWVPSGQFFSHTRPEDSTSLLPARNDQCKCLHNLNR